MTVEPGVLWRVGEPSIGGTREVGQQVIGLPDQLRGRLVQALADLMHGVGDVGPRGRGGVHQAARTGLQLADKLGIQDLAMR